MTSKHTGLAELDQALEAIEAIIRLRDDGQAPFDASAERQWAMAYLWFRNITDSWLLN